MLSLISECSCQRNVFSEHCHLSLYSCLYHSCVYSSLNVQACDVFWIFFGGGAISQVFPSHKCKGNCMLSPSQLHMLLGQNNIPESKRYLPPSMCISLLMPVIGSHLGDRFSRSSLKFCFLELEATDNCGIIRISTNNLQEKWRFFFYAALLGNKINCILIG